MSFFFLLTFFLFSFSCSISKPVVSSLAYKRVLVESENGSIGERLSLFLRFSDKDGTNDYESMNLIHRDMKICWHITRSLTYFFTSDYDDKNSFLVGTNKITYPLGKIPLGEYELHVFDLQGNKVVRFFSIDEEADFASLNASLHVSNGRWEVKVGEESRYTRFYLLLLGADKQPVFLKTLSLSSNSSVFDSIDVIKNEWPDARYVQLCAEDAYRTKGYMSKPIKLN